MDADLDVNVYTDYFAGFVHQSDQGAQISMKMIDMTQRGKPDDEQHAALVTVSIDTDLE